jgi:hypothetical protein
MRVESRHSNGSGVAALTPARQAAPMMSGDTTQLTDSRNVTLPSRAGNIAEIAPDFSRFRRRK